MTSLTGKTRPLNVISPVMAVSERVQRPLGRQEEAGFFYHNI